MSNPGRAAANAGDVISSVKQHPDPSKSPGRLFTCIFITIWLSILSVGFWDLLHNYEENHCQMTYMYEYPKYVNIQLAKSVKKAFPKYRLYLYGEGHYVQKMMASTSVTVSGIPVLFIPGNAGAHEQMRSLASVALRLAENKRSSFHFDYFAADLQDEISGLYGGVLMDQTRFVAECIKKIVKMYKKTSKTPRSVVLVGHSLGGLLARGVFMLPNFDETSVHTVITLATPHQAPVLTLDNAMAEYYWLLDEYWVNHELDKLAHVALVSVGGGYRDLMIRNGLTRLDHLGRSDRYLATSTTSVPKTWLSTDHRAIVWCKQLVLAQQRALFDMVNETDHVMMNDVTERMLVLRHHLLSHTGSERPKSVGVTVKLDSKVKVLDVNEPTFLVKQHPVEEAVHIHMHLGKTEGKHLVATCRKCDDTWVLGCLKLGNTSRCSEATDLSDKAYLIPPEKNPSTLIHLDTTVLQQYEMLIFIVPKTEWTLELQAELYDVTTRVIDLEVPSFFSEFPASLYTYRSVYQTKERGAMYYNFSVPYIETVRQAYRVRVKRTGCYDVTRDHEETLLFHVPWSNEDQYVHGSSKYGMNLTMKYQSGRPENASSSGQLHLYADPDCLYTVDMQIAITEIFGQLVRFYIVLVPGFLVASVLLIFSYQMSSLESVNESRLWFVDLFRAGTHPKRFLPFVVFPHVLISFGGVREWVYAMGVPILDSHVLEEERFFDLRVMPLTFFMSNAITALILGVILLLVKIGSKIVSVVTRCLPGSVKKFGRLMEVGGLCLALVAVITRSGALGLVTVAIVHLIKVLVIYSAQNEQVWLKNRARVAYLMFVISLAMAAITGPSGIVWFKNREFGIYALPEDPWRLLASAYCLTQIIISAVDNERVYSHSSHWTYKSIHVICILIPYYAIRSLNHLPFFVTMVTTVLSLRCLRSVTKSKEMVKKEKKDQ